MSESGYWLLLSLFSLSTIERRHYWIVVDGFSDWIRGSHHPINCPSCSFRSYPHSCVLRTISVTLVVEIKSIEDALCDVLYNMTKKVHPFLGSGYICGTYKRELYLQVLSYKIPNYYEGPLLANPFLLFVVSASDECNIHTNSVWNQPYFEFAL